MENLHNLTAADGHEIRLKIWQPAGEARGVIQLLHGLGEHIGRYQRFAAAAVDRGLIVCAHDHRGHGEFRTEAGYFADAGGWHKVVEDVRVVNDHVREQFADQPVVLLGHSMGSFIAQTFAMHYGTRLAGLLLSGSNWPRRLELLPGVLVAWIEGLRLGRHGRSTLLDRLGFDAFNKGFRPVRTDMDWLSRDANEVDRYIADPLCGGPFTCGLWRDLLGGLFALGSDRALRRVPGELPILITGGSADPVGGEDGMARLAMHYMQTLHQRVQLKIYADGRHEMLNETNRDQVTADWLDWIQLRVRR